MSNKKVLLCEHRRHTTHSVASTHCTALSPGGGVVLILGRGVPTLAGGYLPWPEVLTLAARGTYPGQRYLPWQQGDTYSG